MRQRAYVFCSIAEDAFPIGWKPKIPTSSLRGISQQRQVDLARSIVSVLFLFHSQLHTSMADGISSHHQRNWRSSAWAASHLT